MKDLEFLEKVIEEKAEKILDANDNMGICGVGIP